MIARLVSIAFVALCVAELAEAQELYKRRYEPKCRETYYSGMVPDRFQFQGGFMMWIEVPEWKRLVEPAFREQVLEAAFRENLEYCKARGQGASIAVVAIDLPGTSALLRAWTSSSDRIWRITTDNVAATIAKVEAEQNRRAAELARQREQQEAARRAEEERAKAEQELLAKQEARVSELRKKAEADAQERAKKRPADAYCLFSCDPLEEHARQVLQNRLQSFIKMPVIVMNFRKTNGARAKMDGMDSYELHYQADIELPQGFLPRPKSIWDEMQRGADGIGIATDLKELMNFKVTSNSTKWWDPQSLQASGTVHFRKTERGWQGFDGRLYQR